MKYGLVPQKRWCQKTAGSDCVTLADGSFSGSDFWLVEGADSIFFGIGIFFECLGLFFFFEEMFEADWFGGLGFLFLLFFGLGFRFFFSLFFMLNFFLFFQRQACFFLFILFFFQNIFQTNRLDFFSHVFYFAFSDF